MTTVTVNSIALVIHELNSRVTAFVHNIHVDSSQRYVMGSGRVLSRTDKEDILSILSDKRSAKLTLLPESLLAHSADTMIWWRPAGEATIGFERGMRKVMLPALLFRVTSGELSVAALKVSTRPTLKTQLYHSGLPNVDCHGRWCSGGNRVPDEPRIDQMIAYETTFLESPFTHGSLSPLKNVEDIMEFWQSQKRSSAFSTRRLMSMGHTLQEWIGE